MKRILYVGIFLVLLLAACAPQPAPAEGLVGTEGAGFTLEDALGGETSLADFAGKPVLLYFHMAVG